MTRSALGNNKVFLCPYETMADTATINVDDPATCWVDPVHLVPAVYNEIGSKLIELHSAAGHSGQPAKRIRRDSVEQPMPAVRGRGRPSLPAWVLGKAAPNRQEWSNGRGSRGSFGTSGGRGRGGGGGRGRAGRGPFRGRGWGRARY